MTEADILNFFNFLELNYKEEFDKIEIQRDYDHYGMDFEFIILDIKVMIWYKYQNVYFDKWKGLSVYDNFINFSLEVMYAGLTGYSVPTTFVDAMNQFENFLKDLNNIKANNSE